MSMIGQHHSEETKRKMRENRLGKKFKPMSNEGRKNIGAAQVGKKLSIEHKKKIGLSHLGKKRSEKARENMRLAQVKIAYKKVGKKHTEEHKRNISCGMKGKNTWSRGCKLSLETRFKMARFTGEQRYNWKGKIASENDRIRKGIEIRLWREAIFARDNYTCQNCDERGKELRAHHIYNFADFPNLRFAIDNGVALCKKCHIEFHKTFGNRHNTEIQMIEFLL